MASSDGWDSLMKLLEDPAAQMLIGKIATDTAEHVLLRIGIDATEPASVLAMQANMSFITQHRTNMALMSQDMVSLKAQVTAHEIEDAKQFKHIVSNQTIAAQDRVRMHNENAGSITKLSDRVTALILTGAASTIVLLGSGLVYFIHDYLVRHP